MNRRLAQHAVDLSVAFPIIRRMKEIQDTIPAEVRPDAEGLLSSGEGMASAMLRSAHGESVPSTVLPSSSEMKQWHHAANLAAGAVNVADPTFISSYLAQLPGKQQRLVRSMVSWAQNKTGFR